jgi:four helix bundle protein
MSDFKTLKVWQKAQALVIAIYKSTVDFPDEEKFGLTAQIRRSAASIPANIAEGCGRNGEKDFRRFLGISMGSGRELESHLLLAREVGFLEPQRCSQLLNDLEEVKKMLSGLINKTSRSSLPLLKGATE